MSVCLSVRQILRLYAPGSSEQPPSIVRTSTLVTAGVGVGRVASEKVDVRTTVLLVLLSAGLCILPLEVSLSLDVR